MSNVYEGRVYVTHFGDAVEIRLLNSPEDQAVDLVEELLSREGQRISVAISGLAEAGTSSPVAGAALMARVSSPELYPGYDRLDDSGESSFLCGCKGVDTGKHESWCLWNLLDELVAAGQGLYEAEGGNMRAEAAQAWEQAVGRVGRVRGRP